MRAPYIFPRAGGAILWGVPLEGVADQRAQVARMCAGLELLVVSEGQLTVCPRLVEWVAELAPGCRVYLAQNAWVVGARQPLPGAPVYNHTHLELTRQADARDWWLRWEDGSPALVTGVWWGDQRVLDMTHPGLLGWWRSRLPVLLEQHPGLAGIMWDETYRSLEHWCGGPEGAERLRLWGPEAERRPRPAAEVAQLWEAAMVRLLRWTPTQVLTNGTLEVTPKGNSLYLENSQVGMAAAVARGLAACEALPLSRRDCILATVNPGLPGWPAHAQAAAALMDGLHQCEPGWYGRRVPVNEAHWAPGEFGEALDLVEEGAPRLVEEGPWLVRRFQHGELWWHRTDPRATRFERH